MFVGNHGIDLVPSCVGLCRSIANNCCKTMALGQPAFKIAYNAHLLLATGGGIAADLKLLRINIETPDQTSSQC